MNNELIKNVSKWGNSAGILLPKEWMGNQVKVILVDRTLEIKKEVLEMLGDYLEDIIGVYLVGSYARGEQSSRSDIDVLAISNKTKKEIISGKYHISISTLNSLKKTLLIQPELVLPRIREAKVILNPILLKEFDIKINKESFKEFYKDSLRVLKICKGFVKLDKEEGNNLESSTILYPLILRLRGLFFIKNLISEEDYTKKSFEKWILSAIDKKDFEKSYEIYQLEKEEKSSSLIKIDVAVAENLIKFLEKELRYLR